MTNISVVRIPKSIMKRIDRILDKSNLKYRSRQHFIEVAIDKLIEGEDEKQ